MPLPRVLALVVGRDMVLEEYARPMVASGADAFFEVEKMLRKPGDVGTFAQSKK